MNKSALNKNKKKILRNFPNYNEKKIYIFLKEKI